VRCGFNPCGSASNGSFGANAQWREVAQIATGLRLRFGKSPASSGAAINRRPNDGTRENFSHSSYAITTTSRRPWRVITQGAPRTPSSTTGENAALAFSQLNVFQPFPHAPAFLSL
jgi:hypothetical protein